MKTRKYFTKLILSVILLFFPVAVFAQSQELKVKPQIPLPFVKTNAQGEIDSLDDYIKGVYQLVIGLAAIFAVIMMIIAGYQWILAGGGERTAAAKKRIFSAAIGLILALLSWVILNSITPKLVALHFPKVDPVKPFFSSFEENSCQNNPELQKFAKESGIALEKVKVYALLGPNSKGPAVTISEARCAQTYQSEGGEGGNIECIGAKCLGEDEVCVDGKYCEPVYLHGAIAWGILAALENDLFSKSYVDYIRIFRICSVSGAYITGSGQIIAALDVGEKDTKYAFKFPEGESKEKFLEKIGKCPVSGYGGPTPTLEGFVMQVEVNDDSYDILPTIDDVFAYDRNCKPIFDSDDHKAFKSTAESDSINWNRVQNLKSRLFTIADFQNGATCDLKIIKSELDP